MSMVVIMAAAGLAFDIGRFYSEKRFLQNAADAGALAVANALIRGETNTDAEAEGRDVLTRNLIGSPTGTPGVVTTTPEYESGHMGEAEYLTSGILISGGEVRVAIKSDVSYTFGRVVGFGTNRVGGRARVKTVGDLLPIAVRHYINAPGPFAGAVAPCDGNTNQFQDLVATANTACLGSTSDGSLRGTPSPGNAFNASAPDDDPVNHGPIIALVGQGASPSNAASFRGFVALDIRNFQYASPPSNVFYNGVTSGTNANTLKAMEAGWVATGYPGPDFPPVTTPPDPNDQVGIIDGNSSGIVVDAINDRYDPGAEILAAVYSGTVSSIPDFTYAVPSTATINTNQTRNGSITMSVTKNASFTGVVSTSAFPNWGETTHPWGSTLTPLSFSPSPLTPNGTVTWTTFQTTGAPQGVYTVWVQGHSSSPVLLDHFYPVGISIGSVNRDFSTSGGAAVLIAIDGRNRHDHRQCQHAQQQRDVLRRDRGAQRRGRRRRERRPPDGYRHSLGQPLDDHPQQGDVTDRHAVGQRRDARAWCLLAVAAGDRLELGRPTGHPHGPDQRRDRDRVDLERVRRHPRLHDLPHHVHRQQCGLRLRHLGRVRRHERSRVAPRSGGATRALELAGRARHPTHVGGIPPWRWNTRTRVDGVDGSWSSACSWRSSPAARRSS